MISVKDTAVTDWQQEKLSAIAKKDKWGLPRDWRFWADPFFWIVAALFGAKYIIVAAQLSSSFLRGIDFSLLWLLIGLALLCDAITGWVVYDTYRWDIPNRPLYIFLVLVIWILGMPYYILERPQWLAELERRRHSPY